MKQKFSLKPVRSSFAEMSRKRYFQVTIFVAFVFLALATLLPVWRLFPEVTERFAIPLHYNIHFGVDSFGPWQRIFTMPIFGGAIFIVNFVVAVLLWKKDHVISYFFAGVAVIAELLLFIAMIFVVLLNISFAL